jgi:hypothetical protein
VYFRYLGIIVTEQNGIHAKKKTLDTKSGEFISESFSSCLLHKNLKIKIQNSAEDCACFFI